MKKAGESWKDSGTARSGGRPGRGLSTVLAGPLLGRYRLVGLPAGHVGCTEKLLPNALSPSFPLADVHYGEGGGHPVQPARVQHHRLHLYPRGTDVSTGPLRFMGDMGWPWAGSMVRGRREGRVHDHGWGSPSSPCELGRKRAFPQGFAAMLNPACGDTCWAVVFGYAGLASVGWLSFAFGGSQGNCFTVSRRQVLPNTMGVRPSSACRPLTAQQRGSRTLGPPFISNPDKMSPL